MCNFIPVLLYLGIMAGFTDCSFNCQHQCWYWGLLHFCGTKTAKEKFRHTLKLTLSFIIKGTLLYSTPWRKCGHFPHLVYFKLNIYKRLCIYLKVCSCIYICESSISCSDSLTHLHFLAHLSCKLATRAHTHPPPPSLDLELPLLRLASKVEGESKGTKSPPCTRTHTHRPVLRA